MDGEAVLADTSDEHDLSLVDTAKYQARYPALFVTCLISSCLGTESKAVETWVASSVVLC